MWKGKRLIGCRLEPHFELKIPESQEVGLDDQPFQLLRPAVHCFGPFLLLLIPVFSCCLCRRGSQERLQRSTRPKRGRLALRCHSANRTKVRFGPHVQKCPLDSSPYPSPSGTCSSSRSPAPVLWASPLSASSPDISTCQRPLEDAECLGAW